MQIRVQYLAQEYLSFCESGIDSTTFWLVAEQSGHVLPPEPQPPQYKSKTVSNYGSDHSYIHTF